MIGSTALTRSGGSQADPERILGTLQNPRGRQKRPKQFNTTSFGRSEAVQTRPKVVLEGGWKKNSVFEWIFNDFWLKFGTVFFCFLTRVFMPGRSSFLYAFYRFLHRSFKCVNPENSEKPLVLIHYFVVGTFQRRSIHRRIFYQMRIYFAWIFYHFL